MSPETWVNTSLPLIDNDTRWALNLLYEVELFCVRSWQSSIVVVCHLPTRAIELDSKTLLSTCDEILTILFCARPNMCRWFYNWSILNWDHLASARLILWKWRNCWGRREIRHIIVIKVDKCRNYRDTKRSVRYMGRRKNDGKNLS